jgi:hypothetical protein
MLHLLWWTRILTDPVYWEVQRFHTIISLDRIGDPAEHMQGEWCWASWV